MENPVANHPKEKITIMRIVILSIFLIRSMSGFSCSCGTLEKITQNEIEKVGEAFIGRIKSISINDSSYTISATFEVINYLKGKSFKSEITIQTSKSGGSCGLNFNVGQKWYIFAHYSEGDLYAGLCGRSVQLTKVSVMTKWIIIGRRNYRKEKQRFRSDKRAILKFIKKSSRTKQHH